MEKNFSLGTYSISTDGVSINYSAPSFLPQEDVEKIIFNESEPAEIVQDKKETSFDALLKGVMNVPKK